MYVNKRERYTISPVHDCACYCMHTCLLMLIKIQIENTQSTDPKVLLKVKTSHLWEYSGTSPYGHLTSKKTSQLQSPWLSPNLYSIVQITPCNKVTSPLRSLLPSPVGDLNSEVPLYLKSYKSIKRTAQLKTFKLTLQQLFHCSNKKYQTMFNGKWK